MKGSKCDKTLDCVQIFKGIVCLLSIGISAYSQIRTLIDLKSLKT